MDIHDNLVHRVIDECNKMVKDAAIQIVTNINPENDEIKYTYNSIMRHRIADIRNIKASLILSIKEQILKGKGSGLKDVDVQRLGAQIEKIVKSKKDILDNGYIQNSLK